MMLDLNSKFRAEINFDFVRAILFSLAGTRYDGRGHWRHASARHVSARRPISLFRRSFAFHSVRSSHHDIRRNISRAMGYDELERMERSRLGQGTVEVRD